MRNENKAQQDALPGTMDDARRETMNRLLIRKFAVVAVIATVAFASGCGKKKSKTPPPPSGGAPQPTASITATPQSVDKGDAVVLVWRTTAANDVSIDGIGPVQPNDQKMLAPTATTTYHLVAKGDGGEAEASVTVSINGPAAPVSTAPVVTDNSLTDEATFKQNVQDLYFDYDSYDIRPDATSIVAQDAAWLNAHPNVKVAIGGYCDDRGSTEYNIALGQNRANAAATALEKAGVSSSRIRTVSYGKEKQFCTEQTEACWQQNRRAAFTMDH
jgi:peptidoglycan-associated lipoprotein